MSEFVSCDNIGTFGLVQIWRPSVEGIIKIYTNGSFVMAGDSAGAMARKWQGMVIGAVVLSLRGVMDVD